MLGLIGASAQQPQPPQMSLPQTPPPVVSGAPPNAAPAPPLTRFDLDFPGGTPKQLVAAIEKASGRPLNTLVAEEDANTRIPPFKIADVSVPQLFAALKRMSYRRASNGNTVSGYGFETEDKPPSEDSIWQFFAFDYDRPAPTTLSRFDLDFPGGTPKQLVAAVQKAMGKPLNVIIPEEHAGMKLPALKMENVNVAELFEALESASLKTEAYVTGRLVNPGVPSVPGAPQWQQWKTTYGFKTESPVTDKSIWRFYVDAPPQTPFSEPAKSCRFYSLGTFLESGYTVDDITTAIQTGWKMLGDKETPAISFHKDTKLLIAVGEPNKLETIDAVLRALQPRPPPPAPLPGLIKPKPADAPKTEP